MAVDVTRVKGRRTVHFDRPADIAAEARRLAEGPVIQLGNLSLAQTCGHLATWMNLSMDGDIPLDAPPWLKVFARLFKPVILSRPLPAGFKLPPMAKAVLIPEIETEVGEAISKLENAATRLATEEKRVPSPMLGRLSREDWDRLHCRHAELHFSFLLPGPPIDSASNHGTSA